MLSIRPGPRLDMGEEERKLSRNFELPDRRGLRRSVWSIGALVGRRLNRLQGGSPWIWGSLPLASWERLGRFVWCWWRLCRRTCHIQTFIYLDIYLFTDFTSDPQSYQNLDIFERSGEYIKDELRIKCVPCDHVALWYVPESQRVETYVFGPWALKVFHAGGSRHSNRIRDPNKPSYHLYHLLVRPGLQDLLLAWVTIIELIGCPHWWRHYCGPRGNSFELRIMREEIAASGDYLGCLRSAPHRRTSRTHTGKSLTERKSEEEGFCYIE